MIEAQILAPEAVCGQVTAHRHEQVACCQASSTGPKAIAGTPGSVPGGSGPGPAPGGPQMWPYASDTGAQSNVQRGNWYSQVLGHRRQGARTQTKKNHDFTLPVLAKAEKEGARPQAVASRPAAERVAHRGRLKSTH